MILDIASLIIVLIFAIVGYKTGAAKVIGRLLSVIIAFVAAIFLSHYIATLIYTAFLKPAIIQNVSAVSNDSGLVTASQKAAELMSGFPVFFANILDYFGISESTISGLFNTSAVESIESAIMTPAVALISLILFIILFVIILLVTRKLINLIVKIFRLPLIRILDSIVGVLIGVAEGALIIYILAMIISIAIPFTNGELFILNEEYINTSVFFSFIYNGEITSLVQNFIFSI